MNRTSRAWLLATVLLWSPLGAQDRPSALIGLSEAFRAITAKVSPAIVEISIVALGPLAARPGAAPQVGTQGRSGSGVILSDDGYIITNAHVVANARSVEVLLAQPAVPETPGRSIVAPLGRRSTAKLVGLDVETDLAVLKVDDTDLPFLEFADSDDLLPGNLVLAFGSPFGLESSVTMGVVSAVGRQLEPDAPVVYIQTDAPINPGNSGGALVNTEGQVVGINTLIASSSGANTGIGFALPSNIARTVFEQLREHGRVLRGIVGIEVQTITPAMASGLQLYKDWGVIVSDVFPGSPASRAGLQQGDIIVAMDGKPMENARQFNVNVYQRAPGDVVGLDVARGVGMLSIPVRVVLRDSDPARFADFIDPERSLIAELGVLAVGVDAEVARQMPWLREPGGLVVAATAADAPLVLSDLRPGDVIYRVNREDVGTIERLRNILGAMPTGAAIVLEVNRLGRYRYVALTK